MRYLVIAYDENQTPEAFRHMPGSSIDPFNLYEYLRNEFDNQGIVAGLVECEGLREVLQAGDWLDDLYNSMNERVGV